MIRVNKWHPKSFGAALGLSCLCLTIAPARSATPSGFESGLTAYQFDGIYQGISQRVAGADATCQSGQVVAIEVHNGYLKFGWRGHQVFASPIARDGSFYATSGESAIQADKHMTLLPTLQGKISKTVLVADYGTRLCRYRLEASQQNSPQHLTQSGTPTGH